MSAHHRHTEPPLPPTSWRTNNATISSVRKRPFSSTRESNDTFPPLLDGNDSDDEYDDAGDTPHLSERKPRLTKSMNPCYFDKSAIGKAWQAQKKQTFGKDDLLQTYRTKPVLFHIVLPVLKQRFLTSDDIQNLSRASAPIGKLWSKYQ